MTLKFTKIAFLTLFSIFVLNSCGNGFFKGGDARKISEDPRERVKANLESGKGFRLGNLGKSKGGDFEFASSNELWRASLDTLDFMPLVSANYSGGIIITDWYSENNNDSIKITLRFLSNEVRSDAIDIKIFSKKCDGLMSCATSEINSELKKELKKEILKKAAVYKKQTKDKNFKPYDPVPLGND